MLVDTPVLETVAQVMGLWATDAEFARDIGIKPSHAQTMKVRGSIPVDYWPDIIAAAERRGLAGVTADTLMRIHAPERAAS